MSAFMNVANYFSSMLTRTDALLASIRKQAITGTVPPGAFIADVVNYWFDAAEGWFNLAPGLLADPVPTLFIKLDTAKVKAEGYVSVPMLSPAVDPALPPPPPLPSPLKLTATDVIPLTGTGKIASINVVPSWFDFGTLKVTLNQVSTSGLSSGGRYQGFIYLDTGAQPQLVAVILAIVP
jgi:hypothetical protein